MKALLTSPNATLDPIEESLDEHFQNAETLDESLPVSKDSDKGAKQYNLKYSWTCLGIMVLCFISFVWSKTIIYKMIGYGVIGHEGSFFHINIAISGWSEESYGILVGPAYCIPLGFCLLFSGAISDNFNRKIIIIISTIGWSSITFYNAYV